MFRYNAPYVASLNMTPAKAFINKSNISNHYSLFLNLHGISPFCYRYRQNDVVHCRHVERNEMESRHLLCNYLFLRGFPPG